MLSGFESRAPCRWRLRAGCCSPRPASRPGTRTGPGCTRPALLNQQVALYATSPCDKALSAQRVRKASAVPAIMVSCDDSAALHSPEHMFWSVHTSMRCTDPDKHILQHLAGATGTYCVTKVILRVHAQQGSAHCRS